MKAIKEKSINEIKNEWDNISHLRHRQITNGTDLSYKYVILPCVLELLKNSNFSSILDVGCGTGILEAELASLSKKIVGIDLSSKNIEIAIGYCKELNNVTFENTTIENYAAKIESAPFTLAIANMTLMTCIDLASILNAIQKLLIPGGIFVATFAHPYFWPKYWGYNEAEWFDYKKEIIIEAPFRISKEATNYITTHVHRPLEMYLNNLVNRGFIIDKLLEPVPDKKIQQKYPEDWEFPRFIGIKCTKSKTER